MKGDRSIECKEAANIRSRNTDCYTGVRNQGSVERIRSPNGGAATHAPEDIAGLCAVDEIDLGIYARGERGANLKNELRVRVATRVEGQDSIKNRRGCEVVDAGAEGQGGERDTREISGGS